MMLLNINHTALPKYVIQSSTMRSYICNVTFIDLNNLEKKNKHSDCQSTCKSKMFWIRITLMLQSSKQGQKIKSW